MLPCLRVAIALATFVGASHFVCYATRAADPQSVVVARTISRIPSTTEELLAAHAASNDACRLVEPGKEVVPTDTDRIAYDVTFADGARAAAPLVCDCRREGVVSFGTRMLDIDRADLPLVTASFIVDRVDRLFVALEVRVHQEVPDGPAYLHYQPWAAVGAYDAPQQALAFESLQAAAVADVRGLGLFVPPGGSLVPENLRTLVISIKGQHVDDDPVTPDVETVPSIEMLFVRARASSSDGTSPVPDGGAAAPAGHGLELHTFVTTDRLSRLLYLGPYLPPDSIEQCTVRSTIRITEFAWAGQMPSARAARRIDYAQQSSFAVATLDDYAKRAGWGGGAFENLTATLDAIIEGHVSGE